MNWNPPMDVGYVNNSFPYNSAGSFINFFEGLAYEHVNFIFSDASHAQESMYPCMHTSMYKFGLPEPGNLSYYDYCHTHAVNDQALAVDEYNRHLEASTPMISEQTADVHSPWEGNSSANMTANHVECPRGHHNARDNQVWCTRCKSIVKQIIPGCLPCFPCPPNPCYEQSAGWKFPPAEAMSSPSLVILFGRQDINWLIAGRTILVQPVVWQDNVDPDNMTYEELLELGETVGTQNRGLSQDLISMLRVKKFKCGFFSRKKSRNERCVICQMEYTKGDRQIVLPCKHLYHVGCGTRWLSINKACPICYTEVFGDASKQ